MKYRVHLFEYRDGITKEFPSNTYETDSKETLIKELSDLFDNNQSGISRIVIEDTSYGIPFTVPSESPLKL